MSIAVLSTPIFYQKKCTTVATLISKLLKQGNAFRAAFFFFPKQKHFVNLVFGSTFAPASPVGGIGRRAGFRDQ